MIVIYRNGVLTVITGWRAWLIMLAAALCFPSGPSGQIELIA